MSAGRPSTSPSFWPSLIGLIVLVVLRLTAGGEAMEQVWLGWGNWRDWLPFRPRDRRLLCLQAVLNAVTGLGGANWHRSPPRRA